MSKHSRPVRPSAASEAVKMKPRASFQKGRCKVTNASTNSSVTKNPRAERPRAQAQNVMDASSAFQGCPCCVEAGSLGSERR